MRVLLAEDSAVTREFLVYLLSQDPDIEVVGTVRDGAEAVARAADLRPDLILMDVHMPRMNGYEATRLIMERTPTPIVMISASFDTENLPLTFEAIKAGALTIVEKPGGPGHPDHERSVRHLLDTVRLMAEVKVVRRWPRRAGTRPPAAPPATGKVRLIGIGASTGGPPVLAEILGQLTGELRVPVLVVQHIASGFGAGLVSWLQNCTALPVKQAEAEEPLRSGSVYFAPENLQMAVTADGRIRLSAGPAEDGFCPSVTYLFRSMAAAFGPAAAGILLTGMGRDGAAGLAELRAAGGITIAQDQESSVVFGMPGAAIRLGAAAHVLSPPEIRDAIRSLIR